MNTYELQARKIMLDKQLGNHLHRGDTSAAARVATELKTVETQLQARARRNARDRSR